MRALTADYDVTTYAWKFNLPACMRLWPFYFWVVSTGDTGLGLGRVNLVCVATERSLLTTSTLLQQVKNKHLLPLSTNLNFDAFTAKVAAVAVRLENCRPLDRALL